ncbi:hypothetical protein NEPAR04_2618, partial [Nematocida parisii]
MTEQKKRQQNMFATEQTNLST